MKFFLRLLFFSNQVKQQGRPFCLSFQTGECLPSPSDGLFVDLFKRANEWKDETRESWENHWKNKGNSLFSFGVALPEKKILQNLLCLNFSDHWNSKTFRLIIEKQNWRFSKQFPIFWLVKQIPCSKKDCSFFCKRLILSKFFDFFAFRPDV